ncbi:MAG: hypothetical protein K2Z81_13610, partial [Cyanobacteria bacterium]|nr:hypothetical protein [Cyanobacteriota bacterium]
VSAWCYLMDVATLRVRAKICFDGATRLSPRLQEDVLTLCDDRGRALVIDLHSGAIVRSLCI